MNGCGSELSAYPGGLLMRLAHASPEELVIRKIFHILIQGNDQLSQDRVLTKFMGSGLISEATKQSMQASSSEVPSLLSNAIVVLNVLKHVREDPTKFAAFLDDAELNNKVTIEEVYAQYKNASLLFKSYRAEIESCIPDAIQLCIKLYPHGLVSEEVLEKLINDCSSCDRDGDRKFLIDHICTQIDNNPAVLERFLAVFQEEAGIAELKFCTLSGLAKKIEKRMKMAPEIVDEEQFDEPPEATALKMYRDDFLKLETESDELATELYAHDRITSYARDYIVESKCLDKKEEGSDEREGKLKQYLFDQVVAHVTDDHYAFVPILNSLSTTDDSWTKSAKEIEREALMIEAQRSAKVCFESTISQKSTTFSWEEYGVTVDVKDENSGNEGACRSILLGCCKPMIANQFVPPEEYEFASPTYLIAATKFEAKEEVKVEISVEHFSSSEEELYLMYHHLYMHHSPPQYLRLLRLVEYKDSTVSLTMNDLPALFAVGRKSSSGAANNYDAILYAPESIKGWPWKAAFSVCLGIKASHQKVLKPMEDDRVVYIPQTGYPRRVSIIGDKVELKRPQKYMTSFSLSDPKIMKQDVDSTFIVPKEQPVIVINVKHRFPVKEDHKPKLTVSGLKEFSEICLKEPKQSKDVSLRRSSRKRSHDQNSSQDTPKEEGGPSGLKKARPYEDEVALVPKPPQEFYRELSDIKLKHVGKEILDTIEGILMVVNEPENRATLSHMNPITGENTLLKTITNGVTFIIGMYGEYRVGVVMTRPGNDGPAAAGMKLISALEVVKPSFVISVGVCFGKDKSNQKLGDIIVASTIRSDAYERKGKPEVVRSSHPSVNSQLLDLFQQSAGFCLLRAKGDPVDVNVAPMISGPNLVDDITEKERLFGHFRDAKGGEMEGAGIVSVAQDKGYKAIVIKAIVDWADGTKTKEWQPFGAYAAASYVYHHLNNDVSKSLLTK